MATTTLLFGTTPTTLTTLAGSIFSSQSTKPFLTFGETTADTAALDRLNKAGVPATQMQVEGGRRSLDFITEGIQENIKNHAMSHPAEYLNEKQTAVNYIRSLVLEQYVLFMNRYLGLGYEKKKAKAMAKKVAQDHYDALMISYYTLYPKEQSGKKIQNVY